MSAVVGRRLNSLAGYLATFGAIVLFFALFAASYGNPHPQKPSDLGFQNHEFAPVVKTLQAFVQKAQELKAQKGHFPSNLNELKMDHAAQLREFGQAYDFRVISYQGNRFEVEALALRPVSSTTTQVNSAQVNTEGFLYTKIIMDQDFEVRMDNRVYGRVDQAGSRTPASAQVIEFEEL